MWCRRSLDSFPLWGRRGNHVRGETSERLYVSTIRRIMSMKKLLGPVLLGLLSSASLFAQFGPTGTTTLQVVVGTEAAIRVDTATTNLTTAGNFAHYTGRTRHN